jgi:hypothetical protein
MSLLSHLVEQTMVDYLAIARRALDGKSTQFEAEMPSQPDGLESAAPRARPASAERPDNRRSIEDAKRQPRCRRCFSTHFVDIQIHGGRSIRRDCAQCGLAAGFPMWFGKIDERLRPN